MNDASNATGLRAAQLAWALLELFATGIRVRALGWCLGEIREREVRLSAAGLQRAPGAGSVRARALARRGARHARTGHDIGCLLLGVPLPTAERLLEAWADPAVRAFGSALLNEAVAELQRTGVGPHRGWSPERAMAAARHAVRSQVTPQRPEWIAARSVSGSRPGSAAEPACAAGQSANARGDRAQAHDPLFPERRVRCRGSPRRGRPRDAASPG